MSSMKMGCSGPLNRLMSANINAARSRLLNQKKTGWILNIMDSCAEEVQEHVSLETVRQILAKIPESLAEEIRAVYLGNNKTY